MNKRRQKYPPWRFSSSHFECFVLMWLAHHHEYALLAALCSIVPAFSLPQNAKEIQRIRDQILMILIVKEDEKEDFADR